MYPRTLIRFTPERLYVVDKKNEKNVVRAAYRSPVHTYKDKSGCEKVGWRIKIVGTSCQDAPTMGDPALVKLRLHFQIPEHE